MKLATLWGCIPFGPGGGTVPGGHDGREVTYLMRRIARTAANEKRIADGIVNEGQIFQIKGIKRELISHSNPSLEVFKYITPRDS